MTFPPARPQHNQQGGPHRQAPPHAGAAEPLYANSQSEAEAAAAAPPLPPRNPQVMSGGPPFPPPGGSSDNDASDGPSDRGAGPPRDHRNNNNNNNNGDNNRRNDNRGNGNEPRDADRGDDRGNNRRRDNNRRDNRSNVNQRSDARAPPSRRQQAHGGAGGGDPSDPSDPEDNNGDYYDNNDDQEEDGDDKNEDEDDRNQSGAASRYLRPGRNLAANNPNHRIAPLGDRSLQRTRANANARYGGGRANNNNNNINNNNNNNNYREDRLARTLARSRPLHEVKFMPKFKPNIQKSYMENNGSMVLKDVEEWIRIVRFWILGTLVNDAEKVGAILALCLGDAKIHIVQHYNMDADPETLLDELIRMFIDQRTATEMMDIMSRIRRMPGQGIDAFVAFLEAAGEKVVRRDNSDSAYNWVDMELFRHIKAECNENLKANISRLFTYEQIDQIIDYIKRWSAERPTQSPFSEENLAKERSENKTIWQTRPRTNNANTATSRSFLRPITNGPYNNNATNNARQYYNMQNNRGRPNNYSNRGRSNRQNYSYRANAVHYDDEPDEGAVGYETSAGYEEQLGYNGEEEEFDQSYYNHEPASPTDYHSDHEVNAGMQGLAPDECAKCHRKGHHARNCTQSSSVQQTVTYQSQSQRANRNGGAVPRKTNWSNTSKSAQNQ